tara:strand:- start:13615 stop:14121 length:507 start_codon:yes stop_codon:yes gene_type:complete
MQSKKYRRARSRVKTRRNKVRRIKPRKRQRGGGCLDIYPLSKCGGAVGGCDPFPGPYKLTAKQYGGWRLDDVDGRKSASKRHSKTHKSRHTKIMRKSTKRKSRSKFRKKRRNTSMQGGSGRDPIMGAELQQGLYTIWNTGMKGMNTWYGRKSPSSLNASPLDQPFNIS